MANPYAAFNPLGAGLAQVPEAYRRGMDLEQQSRMLESQREYQQKAYEMGLEEKKRELEAAKIESEVLKRIGPEIATPKGYATYGRELASAGIAKGRDVMLESDTIQKAKEAESIRNAAIYSLGEDQTSANRYFDELEVLNPKAGKQRYLGSKVDKNGNRTLMLERTEPGKPTEKRELDEYQVKLLADNDLKGFADSLKAREANKAKYAYQQAKATAKPGSVMGKAIAELDNFEQTFGKDSDAYNTQKKWVDLLISTKEGNKKAWEMLSPGAWKLIAEAQKAGANIGRIDPVKAKAYNIIAENIKPGETFNIAESQARLKADTANLTALTKIDGIAGSLEATAIRNIKLLNDIIKQYKFKGSDTLAANSYLNEVKRLKGDEAYVLVSGVLEGIKRELTQLSSADTTRAVHAGIEKEYSEIINMDIPMPRLLKLLGVLKEEGHRRRISARESISKQSQAIEERGKLGSIINREFFDEDGNPILPEADEALKAVEEAKRVAFPRQEEVRKKKAGTEIVKITPSNPGVTIIGGEEVKAQEFKGPFTPEEAKPYSVGKDNTKKHPSEPTSFWLPKGPSGPGYYIKIIRDNKLFLGKIAGEK